VTEDLDRDIDALYALRPDRFTAGRDALAKRLRADGDRAAADRVRSLRKPLASAWSLNALVREDPAALAELEGLGRRLRDAHRRVVSGGDAGPLRDAMDERRVLVARLAARAREIREREGIGGASLDEDVATALEAALVDEEAASALRAGRLLRPLRRPVGLGDAPALSVLPGGDAGSSRREEPGGGERERETRRLRRELAAAEAGYRRAVAAESRARTRLEEAEGRQRDARDRLRRAEADRRGAAVEAKRLHAALSKLERHP
jgi:hypothetical protein